MAKITRIALPHRRTALGNISTDVTGISKVDAPNGTIFDRLNQYGISWKDYYTDLPTCRGLRARTSWTTRAKPST